MIPQQGCHLPFDEYFKIVICFITGYKARTVSPKYLSHYVIKPNNK